MPKPYGTLEMVHYSLVRTYSVAYKNETGWNLTADDHDTEREAIKAAAPFIQNGFDCRIEESVEMGEPLRETITLED